MPDRDVTRPNPSPAATGGAGEQLQAKIGAHYLLTLLADAAPRGLPGASVRQVKFQQAAAGYPFDDLVIEGHAADGSPATLEIQSKRTLDFTRSDEDFGEVVARAWEAAQKPNFSRSYYELAVAISRTSTRIERSCQDILSWARTQTSGSEFARHVDRFASAQQRDFVEAFRNHLIAAGGPEGDDVLWQVLSRFQILLFDFSRPGSSDESYAHERARLVLVPEQASKARYLWSILLEEASNLHANGGIADRSALLQSLSRQHGFQFGASPNVEIAQRKLREAASLALADIDDAIGETRLPRSKLVDDCQQALDASRLVEIVGAPGVGKSAILKRLATNLSIEGTVIVLAPGRIVPGGWVAMAGVISCPVALNDLLSELGSGGGGTLFIDNVDQIDDESQKHTIRDLVRGVAANLAWKIIVTTGSGGETWRASLTKEVKQLGYLTVLVGEITDDEVEVVRSQVPALARLLASDHPARAIARNLFYLSRLVESLPLEDASATSPVTETEMARAWWQRGGGRSESGAAERLKILRSLGRHLIEKPSTVVLQVSAFIELLPGNRTVT